MIFFHKFLQQLFNKRSWIRCLKFSFILVKRPGPDCFIMNRNSRIFSLNPDQFLNIQCDSIAFMGIGPRFGKCDMHPLFYGFKNNGYFG